MRTTTLGLIVANRDVFPIELAKRGREEMLAKLQEAGIDVVAVTERDTADGVISNWQDAAACGEVFRENSTNRRHSCDPAQLRR